MSPNPYDWCPYKRRKMPCDSGSGCCCSVSKLCPTLFHPLDCTRQVSLSSTISWSLLKLMSIKLMMLSNHLILCCPCLLLPSVFPTIRVFSSELTLHIRWPKYWSFSFSISPSKEYSVLISFRKLVRYSHKPRYCQRLRGFGVLSYE